MLRSLFDLRKSCGADATSDDNSDNGTLTFRNCRWSPRVLASLRKLLARDQRKFSAIRFLDCSVEESSESGAMFSEVLATILENNASKSLVVRGGRPIGSRYDTNGNDHDTTTGSGESNGEERRVRTTCGSPARSPATSNPLVVAALRRGLSAGKTTLESLRLSGLRFASDDGGGGSSWFESLATNATLRSLDLSGTVLSSTAVGALAGALSRNRGLRSLSLAGSSLDDASMGLLIGALGDHPALARWNLSGNRLGAAATPGGGPSTLALDALAGLLRSGGSRLESLDLSRQAAVARAGAPPASGESFRSSLRAALRALSSNTRLSSIDLSGNPGLFSDLPTAGAVADCLAANRGLRHADLSSCGMTAGGIARLAGDCLPRCGSNLRSLVLFAGGGDDERERHHPGGTVVARALREGLRSNATLESLGESVPCEHVRHVLDTNRGGRRAFLNPRGDPGPPPVAAWPRVLARANAIDYDTAPAAASVVFELLRRGPVLRERRGHGTQPAQRL